MQKRAAFYIDGFNLYHAVKDLGVNRLKWFSIWDYADFIAKKNNEALVKVHYFSALAHYLPASAARHRIYLRALKSTGVVCTLGQFKEKPRGCHACHTRWIGHEEKETDVNIALQLLEDAVDDAMDVCYLLSGDSDLAPAVKAMQRRSPAIEFVTVAPPGRRHAGELLSLAQRNLSMGGNALTRNRLPDSMTDANGTFGCPPEYI